MLQKYLQDENGMPLGRSSAARNSSLCLVRPAEVVEASTGDHHIKHVGPSHSGRYESYSTVGLVSEFVLSPNCEKVEVVGMKDDGIRIPKSSSTRFQPLEFQPKAPLQLHSLHGRYTTSK